jgi:rSAM/selenodomain-associated transferase 1
MPATALAIMARCPEKGKVKTRLANSIGEEKTLQLYQAFLVDLATRFSFCDHYDLYWACTSTESDFTSSLSTLLPAQMNLGQILPQRGTDLADRLYHVVCDLKVSYQQLVIIASDSPHISSSLIEQALQALSSTDIVLGPCEDGGYYLIAMHATHDVFHDIQMSTSTVLQETIKKAQDQHLAVHLLDPLLDVDEVADLQRLANLLQANPPLAPATAACLNEILEEVLC